MMTGLYTPSKANIDDLYRCTVECPHAITDGDPMKSVRCSFSLIKHGYYTICPYGFVKEDEDERSEDK